MYVLASQGLLMKTELVASLRQGLEGQGPTLSGRWIVAYSGGADSTALLMAMSELYGEEGTLVALHANHGLHPDARHWQAHCQARCDVLNVPLVTENLTVEAGPGLEARARSARYEFFRRQMGAGDVLVLAHHREDQLETTLLRLLQGRGIMTMGSIRGLGSGHLVRPLLNCSKQALVDYLQDRGVDWLEDPSNTDVTHDRNYLRHRVLPGLMQRWPDMANSFGRVSQDARAQEGLLQEFTASLADRTPADQLPEGTGARRIWLRHYLAHRAHFAVSDKKLDEFLRQIADSGRGRLGLEAGYALECWRGHFYYREGEPRGVPRANTLALGEHVPWGARALWLEPCARTDAFAFACQGALSLQSVEQAKALGLVLPSKLKNRFQSAGIPPWERGEYPVLISNHRVVCLPGVWINPALGSVSAEPHGRLSRGDAGAQGEVRWGRATLR